jgi:hypothetical protein
MMRVFPRTLGTRYFFDIEKSDDFRVGFKSVSVEKIQMETLELTVIK